MIKSLMAGSLQFRILGQVLPHDSKLQTAGHQTFNPGLGAWEALIFLENQWKARRYPGRIITMMSYGKFGNIPKHELEFSS